MLADNHTGDPEKSGDLLAFEHIFHAFVILESVAVARMYSDWAHSIFTGLHRAP